MVKNAFNKITSLLSRKGYPLPSQIQPLPTSGSDRKYFRVFLKSNSPQTVIVAYNPDVSENNAWLTFSHHFRSLGFHVPEILGHDETLTWFILSDLGNTTLFHLVQNGFDEKIKAYYKKVINDLIRFQVEGINGLDLHAAYPTKSFNRSSVNWDLNYFKYYFIKPNGILFNEEKLEKDFDTFTVHLLKARSDFFMYRDFQSRNIMLFQDEPWYIDFQGGRKGPLQYDLVSLLYQARANLSSEIREELKAYYLAELEKVLPGETKRFDDHYNSFIYFRLMQVLGAYGFRGKLQRKAHFLISTGYAIDNLEWLLNHKSPHVNLPELSAVFQQIVGTNRLKQQTRQPKNKLTIRINSFSFIRSGIPEDPSLNGGGFVFDCRALPNPGRMKELKNYSGLEDPVIQYLRNSTEVKEFLQHVYFLIDQCTSNYLERGFEHLQVNFGCTGGKHRSVFCASQLEAHLKKYGSKISIITNHLMSDNW